MPSIDVEKFLTQTGVRKARFGGFDEDDVRAAMRTLCAEYDQRLNHVQSERQRLSQENASLVQQCRTLAGQNRMLSSQNATLAGNGEQYSRQSQELGTEVSRLQQRNRSLHDQCAVLRLKNNDLTDENASLKAAAEQAEAALRLRGKELADEIAALRASRQQKLNEAAAEASATLADARRQADALLAEAQAQAEAIAETARQQARAQAQNLVDAAAAEANEIQNAHQLRLNELNAEVRRMEARREKMLQYFNQVGNELLRTGAAAGEIDLSSPEPEPPAELPEDLLLQKIPTPAVELDLSPAAIAAARAERKPAPPAAEDETDLAAGNTLPTEEPIAPAQEIAPADAGPARRTFTLADVGEPAPVPAAPIPAADDAADDADWQGLTLDPAPAPDPGDPLATPGALWPDLTPQTPAPPAAPAQAPAAPPPAAPDPWADFGAALPDSTAAVVEDDVSVTAQWQDIGFDESVPAAPAADAADDVRRWSDPVPAQEPPLWQDLAPAAPAEPSAAPAAAARQDEMWQDLAPFPATAPAEQAAAPMPSAPPAPAAPAAQAAPAAARQTAPNLTEVPGAIFSSPIVRQQDPAPVPDLAADAPAAAPRAPLLPGQEPETAEDEDTLSGLVAKPADPAAGAAWQRRHKAIRAIQALRRLYQ